jgi:hypothetical protein
LGDRKDFRIGEKVGEVISGTFSFFFVGGLKKYKPISAEIVAKAMLRISLLFKTGIHFFESDEISDKIFELFALQKLGVPSQCKILTI